MKPSVNPDTAMTAQRFDRREKPGFVFAVGQDHVAWQSVRRLGRPSVHSRPELGWAVSIAIEQHQDRTTVRLYARKSYHSLHSGLSY